VKHHVKKAYTATRHLWRLTTAPVRTLPDFLIIGAQKCGTTFLYQLLVQHPHVKPAFAKEVHYFDLNFERGDNWYRSHFPLQMRNSRTCITGEASPYYLFHPHAPRRASAVVPDAKLVVLLRNPVDRAYSHYQHQVKRVIKGQTPETLPFEEAIEVEERILPGEVSKMLQNEYYASSTHRARSYLSRGIYIDQLLAWSRFFQRKRMLILKSEDLFSDTTNVLERMLDFLEIPHWAPETYSIPNKREYTGVSPLIRQRLDEYYKPHNQRLYEYLGVDLGW
jgi:sulfotransferase family protein